MDEAKKLEIARKHATQKFAYPHEQWLTVPEAVAAISEAVEECAKDNIRSTQRTEG